MKTDQVCVGLSYREFPNYPKYLSFQICLLFIVNKSRMDIFVECFDCFMLNGLEIL